MAAIIRLKPKAQAGNRGSSETTGTQAEIRQFPCIHNRHLLIVAGFLLAGLSLTVEFMLIGQQLSRDEVRRMNAPHYLGSSPVKPPLPFADVAASRAGRIPSRQGKPAPGLKH